MTSQVGFYGGNFASCFASWVGVLLENLTQERGASMKNIIAQTVSFINKFDRRQVQFTYFMLMLAMSVLMRSPSDGGSTSI